MVSFEHWKKTCLEEKEEEEVADKLHNEIIAVILPPPRIRPGKRIRVTSVTRWRPVQKKQLEFYRIAIARTLMIMMVVTVGKGLFINDVIIFGGYPDHPPSLIFSVQMLFQCLGLI